MVPNAPPNTVLDVKKSSFKKLSKFLEEKERNGLLHIKAGFRIRIRMDPH
jgi:hypothetical protein